ncbi:MAG TPA: glycosyltransferase family 1 protein [Chloroflexota bacterium]|nr:glycosyltransferase family 1 protein [Chloroflexota bacterium]
MSTEGATIALDARLIGYAAGIARHATLLWQALLQLDGPERYVLLRSRRGGALTQPVGPASPGRRGVTCLTPPHHRLERWALPLEVLARAPATQVLHSIDHVAPAWGRWRSVVTLHDLAFLVYPETHTPASRAYYAAAGESARRAARVIAVSQRTASDAVRLLGVDPARMRVIHNAVDPRFGPRPTAELLPLAQRLGFAPDVPYVLFVGTLEPRKNVPLVFDAVADLRRHIDVQLLLAGARGWLDGPIYAAHERSGLGGAAHFLGWLGEPELAVLYSQSAVFVLPSLYEGFGLPVLEAMACGAPVVCSNAGPLPEIAGDAALVLPPDDPAVWADAMARVITQPRLADDLRMRGRRRAQDFAWDGAARATREVYREALRA